MKTLVLIQMLLLVIACAADELRLDAAASGVDDYLVTTADLQGLSR